MKTSTESLPEPSEAEIQHTAYLLWIESGRPAGRDLEHWFAAKELLRHHHGRPLQRGRSALSAPVVLTAAPRSTHN